MTGKTSASLPAFWLLLTCSTGSVPAASQEGPEFQQIERDLLDHGEAEVHHELLRKSPLPLPDLRGQAALVELEGRTFPVRAIYYRDSGPWQLVWLDSQVVAAPPFPRMGLAPGRKVDAAGLAATILRLFEDPDERYALVIENRDDIPLNRPNSDFHRDLAAKGLHDAQRREVMLSKVDAPLAPPVLENERLEFYSWSYFGGAVKRWRAEVGDEYIRVTAVDVLATETGSYDLFP